jgi:hypothetical protein
MKTAIPLPNLTLAIALLGDGAPSPDLPWSPCIARVVDGATHRTVAGVEVWWLDPGEVTGEDAFIIRDRGLVPEEWIRRLGHHATSDAAGDVALPRFRAGRIVVAWHDGKFARREQVMTYPQPRIVALELENDVGQRMRVVDRAGRPLSGIEVAAWCEERGLCANCGPNDDRVWMAPTDARGEAVVPHAQWFFAHGDRGGNLGGRIHLVGFGFPTSQSKRLGRDLLRGEPPAIELVAPPLESLEFELRLESGELCTRPTSVDLAPYARSGPFFSTGRPFGSWLARDGRVVLPHVERGLPWNVAWALDDASGSVWDDVAVADADSSTPNGLRSARANHRRVRVRGRALDAEGHPRAGRTVAGASATATPDEIASRPFSPFDTLDVTSTADPDGRFTLHFDLRGFDTPDSTRRPSVLLAIRGSRGTYSTVAGAKAQVPVTVTEATRELDLGDVVVPLPFVTAAGRAVDLTGAPIPGVKLRFDARHPKLRAFDTVESLETDEAGRFELCEFELCATEFRAPFTIEGEGDGWFVAGVRTSPGGPLEPPMTRVAEGSVDIEVALARRGGARGRIVLPAGASATDYEVVAIQLSDSTLRPVPTPTDPLVDRIELGPDGVFELRGPPHDIAVEVRPRDGERALATSTVVRLPEHGVVEPPELVLELAKATKRK